MTVTLSTLVAALSLNLGAFAARARLKRASERIGRTFEGNGQRLRFHTEQSVSFKMALGRGAMARALAPLFVAVAILLSACASTPVPEETVDARSAASNRAEIDEVNQKLAALAVQGQSKEGALAQDYSIGAGDALDISVFGVEELNKTVRVSSRGMVMLPLLGELKVSGQSPAEVEDLIQEALKQYVHDPSVSVYVSDYQAHQVSVTGAVGEPGLHSLVRPRTVMELLSMSGGLSETAGKKIYVQTRIDGEPQRLIMDLDQVLLDPNNDGLRVLLQGGDGIFVPEAGTVFVEGAVNKPGAYKLASNAGVMEAIAMAGGTKFSAREELVRVISKRPNSKEPEVVSVDLDEIKANETPNLALQDGDIVLVPESGAKAGFVGFWRGFSGIFGVGYGLNGP